MERGSDKHAPLLDEQLKQETRSIIQGSGGESRADEGREQEGPAEGEPTPDARLVRDEIEDRAELARHLQPSVFPARPARLVESAESQHAPQWIIQALESLPDDTYETTEAVWEALGGVTETRGLS